MCVIILHKHNGSTIHKTKEKVKKMGSVKKWEYQKENEYERNVNNRNPNKTSAS